MSFFKGVFRGDPSKSAAKHERRAKMYQERGEERKAADAWASAGRDFARVPDYKRAQECLLQAAQFYLVLHDEYREESTLRTAVDIAFEAETYEMAIPAIDQLTRLGTRLENNQLLILSFSLKTLAFIASNDLAKATEATREAEKVKKRMGRTRVKTPLFEIIKILVSRFIEGEPVSEEPRFPSKTGESETIDLLVKRLVALYQETATSKLELSLTKDVSKIKEQVPGQLKLRFPTMVQVIQSRLQLPPNVILIEPFNLPKEIKTKAVVDFRIEANLPGEFNIGPAFIAMQVNNQQLQLQSNTVQLSVAAAKPKVEISIEPSTSVKAGEEFELTLQVTNTSHGEATDVIVNITLPPTLSLITGTLEKQILSLVSQQSVQFPIYVIASKAGKHEGTIECKYRGPSGRRKTETRPFLVEAQPRPRKGKD
jgi:uncharacterized repeat protein (TIGR01451 family)